MSVRTVIVSLMALSLHARADVGVVVTTLPATLDTLQSDLTKDDACEANWNEQFAEVGGRRWSIDDYTTFWVLPCSRRDVLNPTYRVWAEYAETPPVYRRVELPLVELDGRISARDEIYAFDWKPLAKTLTSTYRIQGRPDCGSQMIYTWDESKQRFELTRAFLKPKCDGDRESWPEIPVPR